jgi:hypothetical protein
MESVMELTDREKELIVQSLRVQEKHSRQGFIGWMNRNLDKAGTDEWNQKCARIRDVLAELVAIRAKFGDTTKVEPAKRDR